MNTNYPSGFDALLAEFKNRSLCDKLVLLDEFTRVLFAMSGLLKAKADNGAKVEQKLDSTFAPGYKNFLTTFKAAPFDEALTTFGDFVSVLAEMRELVSSEPFSGDSDGNVLN
jgi:hypothetical protein